MGWGRGCSTTARPVPSSQKHSLLQGLLTEFSNIYPWNLWHQSRYKFHHPQSAPSAALRGLMLFHFQRFCLFIYKTILWHIPTRVYWAPGITFPLSACLRERDKHPQPQELTEADPLAVYKCLRLPMDCAEGRQWSWRSCWCGEPNTIPGWDGNPMLILLRAVAMRTHPGDCTAVGSRVYTGEAHTHALQHPHGTAQAGTSTRCSHSVRRNSTHSVSQCTTG